MQATSSDMGQVMVYETSAVTPGQDVQPHCRLSISAHAACSSAVVSAVIWMRGATVAAGCDNGRIVTWDLDQLLQAECSPDGDISDVFNKDTTLVSDQALQPSCTGEPTAEAAATSIGAVVAPFHVSELTPLRLETLLTSSRTASDTATSACAVSLSATDCVESGRLISFSNDEKASSHSLAPSSRPFSAPTSHSRSTSGAMSEHSHLQPAHLPPLPPSTPPTPIVNGITHRDHQLRQESQYTDSQSGSEATVRVPACCVLWSTSSSLCGRPALAFFFMWHPGIAQYGRRCCAGGSAARAFLMT